MQFTHEHREIQKTLKRFIDEEINPHVDEWEAAEIFPAHEVFKKMGNLGLLGLCKPEEYGGQGLDPRWPGQIPPPLATPNSPRQDRRIMTTRVRRRCVRRPP